MVLTISIGLDGYLLKGIAAGLGSAAAKGGVWFSSQEKDEPKPQWEEVSQRRQLSENQRWFISRLRRSLEVLSPLPPCFVLLHNTIIAIYKLLFVSS
jgi:hypothetical protein